ncbi:hypothetical protein HanRHA438_Chr11g0506791 [Helianthus annuus]|uniref:Uncharacterized protein n=1 Tax=Helianthus annuus TaxID=4232 RepID=A0A9K3HQ55_HELAN|nr:uncharacterized protein LOC110879513 [Helianthus annuus]KAF5782290.1 hypothetical protein HanXRQr2_Chr11g0494161 [Helianthus annuus]KAJ0501786.1 hypothetical protein HanHA300_Chr11g0405131 [Helianthus annuus]KAJ0509695.1 hypothetical protein HanIR_Chr11g0532081 [Helianthus annuus]KAJ0517711.1 hypothetical protein HanHA89_Chr11g0428831 [Helianthus annuus]KAJ0685728.1 hypothetical protein HanLR1_Chr11g0406331 [Helianthus annuus]
MVWVGRLRRPLLQAVGRESTRALSGSRKSRVRKTENDKSEWWVVDGEMHEIGDNVPPRERFVIPRDNIPNKRRKQLREQFMRRTRLVLKDSLLEHEQPWCKKYMELYQELRENWERLYWDEGYSKKHAQERAPYDSAEDDNQDFSPYSTRQPHAEETKNHTFGRNRQQQPQGGSMEKVGIIRDKFEFDRQRRMRDKAFAPMRFTAPDPDSSRNQSFDTKRYLSSSDSD